MLESEKLTCYVVYGAHTRTVNIATPTVGGLMKFAVKSATCLGCKAPLPRGGKLNKGEDLAMQEKC